MGMIELKASIKKWPFTAKEAKKIGYSRQLLQYYIKKGQVERIAHGVYSFSEERSIDLIDILREIIKIIPHAVIGHKTALTIYDLTEESLHEFDLIVPKNNIPKRELENVVFHQAPSEIYRKDVKLVHGLPVTSIERTIIDLLRKGQPLSLILEVINEAKRKKIQVSLSKLKRLASVFRAQKKIDILLEAIVSTTRP